ncbi:hypothetical protein NBRC116494_35330 [Aurantivibrio plasticivorans]
MESLNSESNDPNLQGRAQLKKILVVDDDPHFLELVKVFLDEIYLVDTLQDGILCLEYFRKGKGQDVDLILLDVSMPYKDGLGVCRDLREMVPNIPVMFISARDSKDERLAGYMAGAQDYIVKPFEPGELLSKVENLFNQQAEVKKLAVEGRSAAVAFSSAMAQSSDMGLMMRFVDHALELTDEGSIASAIVEACDELAQLKVAVCISNTEEPIFWSTDGPCPPMELETLVMLQESGRIYEHDDLVQFNQHPVSVLVKNLPQDKMDRGRITDNLPLLLKAASTCVQKISSTARLTTKDKLIDTVQQLTGDFFEVKHLLGQEVSNMISSVEKELQQVRSEVEFMGLPESQENKLFDCIERASNAADMSGEQLYEVSRQFDEYIEQLRDLL